MATQVFPESELTRDSIQLVGIDETQLIEHEKELKLKKKKEEKEIIEYLKLESKFIDSKEKLTKKEL